MSAKTQRTRSKNNLYRQADWITDGNSKLTREEWLALFKRYCTSRTVTVQELCNDAGITSRAFYIRFAKFKRWCEVGTTSPVLDIDTAIKMAEEVDATRRRIRKTAIKVRAANKAARVTDIYKENK